MSFVAVTFRADSEQVRWLIASTFESTHHMVNVSIITNQGLAAQLAGEPITAQYRGTDNAPLVGASM